MPVKSKTLTLLFIVAILSNVADTLQAQAARGSGTVVSTAPETATGLAAQTGTLPDMQSPETRNRLSEEPNRLGYEVTQVESGVRPTRNVRSHPG